MSNIESLLSQYDSLESKPVQEWDYASGTRYKRPPEPKSVKKPYYRKHHVRDNTADESELLSVLDRISALNLSFQLKGFPLKRQNGGGHAKHRSDGRDFSKRTVSRKGYDDATNIYEWEILITRLDELQKKGVKVPGVM